MKIVIAYCSPAGSTRQVAEIIQQAFNQRKADVILLDLAKNHERSAALDEIKTTDQQVCLFIGSPVKTVPLKYFLQHHAAFYSDLPIVYILGRKQYNRRQRKDHSDAFLQGDGFMQNEIRKCNGDQRIQGADEYDNRYFRLADGNHIQKRAAHTAETGGKG